MVRAVAVAPPLAPSYVERRGSRGGAGGSVDSISSLMCDNNWCARASRPCLSCMAPLSLPGQRAASTPTADVVPSAYQGTAVIQRIIAFHIPMDLVHHRMPHLEDDLMERMAAIRVR